MQKRPLRHSGIEVCALGMGCRETGTPSICTDFPDRARVFTEGPNCSAIQAEMNVISDSPEILAICEEFNLAAINRGPLAMGLLTGKYTPDVTLP